MTTIDHGARWGSKRRLRIRVTLLAGVEYLATCAFLFAYWWIGLASAGTAIALFAYSLIANALIIAAIGSGWSERLDDPSMTTLQMIVSCGRDFLGCLFMPGLWFIFVFNLFIALPFGSLQFTNRTFAAFWLGTCAGLGLVFLKYPGSLQIGFSSVEEKVLLWLFLSAALARLMLFNARISALRRKLRSKAVELAQAGRRVERERVARELHDTVLQTFFGLVYRLTALTEQLPEGGAERRHFEAALQAAEQALAQGRDQVFELRFPTLPDRSLVQSLRRAGEDLAYDTGLSFVIRVPGDEIALLDESRAAIEAIVLQALTNAFHHSRGRQVWLELGFAPKLFTAEVRDDGLGAGDESLSEDTAGKRGMHVMRERAEALGARLTIAPATPGGIVVRLVVPARHAYDLPRPPAQRWPAWARRARTTR